MVLRITTWNVNGIRNPFGYQPWRDKRTFDGMFDVLEADIVIMQELKIQRKDLRDDMVLVPGWDCYFSLPKHKKGYSGVGIYTRQAVCAPIRAEEGLLGVLCPPNSAIPYCQLPQDQHIGGYLTEEQLEELDIDAAALDAEGRCMILEFPAFVLFGIYAPANSSGLRDDYRFGFHSALDTRIRNLIALGKRVVVTGDLNVSREELDTANAYETLRKEGMSHEDYLSTPNRRIFNQLLEGGEVIGERDKGREKPVLWDICRGFHPDRKGMYTHWEQKINARPGNFGSRIDFVLCSLEMKSWIYMSDIQEGLMGSDHCPVFAVINDKVTLDGQEVDIKDIMNPKDTFLHGKRLKEWSVKDVPSASGRLLKEFDKRRSIKDMFGPPAYLQPSLSMASVTAVRGTDSAASDTKDASVVDSWSSANDDDSIASSTIKTPERKRSAPEPVAGKSLKRSKSGSATSPATTSSNGQKSLTRFFKAKPSVKALSVEEVSGHESNATAFAAVNDGSFGNENKNGELEPAIEESAEPPSPEEFIDPIVSKESWGKLFTKPASPRCEHGEPCKTMKTKIKGINCGREFWMCARPLGPSGTKETNTQWRCKTFIWNSDWNGGTGR